MATKAGTAFVEVRYDPDGIRRLRAQTAAEGRRVTSSFAGAAKHAGKLLAIGLGTGVAVGLVKSVQAAADFQKQLNILQAVTHSTGSEMSRAGKLALQLGSDVKLPATSASDAAVALTELAKGGLTLQSSMKAARGTLQLAAAGELAVADAARITAVTLNQFGLAGGEAARVADLLAGAANASTGNVSDFAEALKFAGGAAHNAGLTVTETVAALAEMAAAGLQGSLAGTSFANALRALQAPTAKSAALMKTLGISIFDAQGNTKSLSQITDVFTKKLGNMTEKQQTAALATIFGTRSVQAARAVFLKGTGALAKYTKAVSDKSNVERLAEARTKGFSGALQALQSTAETLAIQIGLKLLPKLTEFANFLTANLPGAVATSTSVVSSLADAAASVIDSFQGMVDSARPVLDVLKTATFNEAGRDLAIMGVAAITAGKAFLVLRNEIIAARIALLTMNPATLPIAALAAGITGGFLLSRRATQGMSQAMDNAKRSAHELGDALRELKSDTLDVRQAELDRTNAAKNLAGINQRLTGLAKSGQKDSKAFRDLTREQTQAEIDLARARLRVSDSTTKVIQDQGKIAAAQRKTAQSFDDARHAAQREAIVLESTARGATTVKTAADKVAQANRRGTIAARLYQKAVGAQVLSESALALKLKNSDPVKAQDARRTVLMALAAVDLAKKLNRVPKAHEINVFYRNNMARLALEARVLAGEIAAIPSLKTVTIKFLQGHGTPGARAGGGPVTANTPFSVGEKGPEIFVPKVNGMIIPNHAIPATAGGPRGDVNVQVFLGNEQLEPHLVRVVQADKRRTARTLQAGRSW